MTQINSKMESITSGIDRIEQFLEDERRSDLESAFKEFNRQKNRTEYIRSEQDMSIIIMTLTNIRMKVTKYISQYEKQIRELVAEMKENDKIEDAVNKIQKLTTCVYEYYLAVKIASATVMLELSVKRIMNPKEIQIHRDEINEIIERYKKEQLIYKQTCEEYLQHSKAFNKLHSEKKWSILGYTIQFVK